MPRVGPAVVNALAIFWILSFAGAFVWFLASVDIVSLSFPRIVAFGLLPLAGTVGIAALFRAPLAIRGAIVLSLSGIGAGTYGAQSFLVAQMTDQHMAGRAAAAKRLGIPLDRRHPIDVALDLRKIDPNAYPIMLSHFETPIGVEGRKVIPLTGISGVRTVLCNERGNFEIYESDRFGLNNPASIWTAAQVDVAVIGDSFVHGYCVPREQNMVGRIRGDYPATANLGLGSRGPMIELAMLSEYARPLKPRAVVWVFTECNDLQNLQYEESIEFLGNYLRDSAFTQRLIERQDDVDAALKTAFEKLTSERFGMPYYKRKTWLDILLLRKLRDRLGVRLSGPSAPAATKDLLKDVLPLFFRIVAQAAAQTKGWGGTFLFVYLPSYYTANRIDGACENIRPTIKDTLSAKGIPMLDLTDVLINPNEKPAEIWYYKGSHLTPRGYDLAAAAVVRRLRALVGPPTVLP